MSNTITVEAFIHKDIDTVWKAWNEPEHITKWLFASDDWECPKSSNDIRVGGTLVSTMRAKDLSQSFDISGIYTAVDTNKYIAYTMADSRKVESTFTEKDGGVQVSETFETENQNPAEMQRAGWQAILNNFKKHAESL